MTAKSTLEIDGNLNRNPFAELLVEIAQSNLSGSLRISKDEHKVVVYFDEGDIVFAVSNTRKHRLFEILLTQDQISRENLGKIENFTNDFYLAKELVEKDLYSKEDVNLFFSYQIKNILIDALIWNGGQWQFSSLARIKEGLRFEIDVKKNLYGFGKNQDIEQILGRFKSFDEKFSLNPKCGTVSDDTSPQEAFVLTRMSENATSINEIRSMSGLEDRELMPILYRLWLGGFIFRENWSSAISGEDIERIDSAKITLKTSALSVEEERKREEEEKAAEEERIAEEKAKKEADTKQSKIKEKKIAELSLIDYIKRIDSAATHYEIFDVPPNTTVSEVKKSYFALAKKFHPDMFHKKVEPDLLLKIQNSFTDIAQAYETLKDEEKREVYDFKLRKVIKKLKTETENSDEPLTKEDINLSNQASTASDNFDKGYELLLREKYHNALPLLGRAVHADQENARYHAFYGQALSFDKTTRHKAESELQTAIKLDSGNAVYRIMLAELFIEIGLTARAKGELKRLLKTTPNNAEAKSLLDSLANK